MKNLLVTTALVTLLAAGPALAQDTKTPAAGADATVTTDTTVTTEAAPAAPAAEVTTQTEAAPAAEVTTDAQVTAPAMPEITAPEGFVRQDVVLTADDLIGATIYDANGDSIGNVSDLVFDSSAAVETTVPGTEAAPADAMQPVDGMAADPAAPADAMAEQPAAEADAAASMTPQTITHAVVDVGGFLGMGQHRSAVPVSDLTVYTNDSETRVYLPWTREQIEALPVYDENDPATLGATTSIMAN
ncbi:MAG: PRC-barrel domain-containing protein [Alphaproteobacteria bacterium]|nr:PRC-barrel domain-containing protein [Alphaproteobacteria bacterium]